MSFRIFSVNSGTGSVAVPPSSAIYELNAAAIDNGDNTYTINYGYSPNTLTSGSIVGLGSSTMNGAGATATEYQLRTLLSNWVVANTNSVWHSFSLNGYYSDKLMPYGTSNVVDYHRCIDAVLALNPTVIILSLPSNDIDYNSNSQFMDNLVAIDTRCKARNCTLFVTQTQPRNNYTFAQQENLRTCATLIKNLFKTRCIEIFDELADVYSPTSPARMKPQYDGGDSIHMNDAGHAYVFSKCIETMQNYFQFIPFNSYRVDRSTSFDFSSFTTIESGIPNTTFSRTYPRNDGTNYYYRVVGVMNNESDSSFSNVTALQQEIYVGDVEETINCNLTLSTQLVGTSDWNDIVPSGDIANTGETFSNLKNSLGASTAIDLVVTGGFSVSAATGNTLGTLYPDNAERSFWATVIGSSVDAIGDQASLKFTDLDDNYTYSITIFPSRASSDTSRILAAYSSGKYGSQSAGAAGGGNKSGVIRLRGIKPTAGEIEIFFGGLVFGFGYVNVIVLERNDKIFKVKFSAPVLSCKDPLFLFNDVNGPNITKINFTGTTGSGLSSWNDINVVAGTTFNLNNSQGSSTSLTCNVNFIAAGTLDNGASYGGGDRFPAAVLRYSRNRTLGFVLTIGGCDPSKTYSFDILSTRLNSTVTNRFAIGSTVKTLDNGNNTTNYVTFTGLVPNVSGNIVVNIDNALGSGTCYLTAMIITESLPVTGLTVTFTPDTMTCVSPTIDVVIPTKIVFDADSLGLTQSVSEIRLGGGVPFIFTTSPMHYDNTTTFNTNTSFSVTGMSYKDGVFNVSGAATASPYTFTKGHLYDTVNDAYIYTPAGYNDNSNNYPLIIMLHGSGISTVDQAITQGPGLRINNGDRPVTSAGESALMIFPCNGGAATWNPDKTFAALSFMNSNYRVDLDRVYVTGLSLGGAGSARAFENNDTTSLGPRNLCYSAAFMVCGSASNTYDYSLLGHAGWWTLHGTLDTTQNYGNTPKIAAGIQAVTHRQPCLTTWFWGVGHNIYTSHTYDRFNKTNSSGVRVGGAAKMDWFDWIMKFSRDALKNATLHVAYAETGTNWTIQYFDYLLALSLVNDLSPSGAKTALLNRLTTLKTAMDGGSRRFVLDLGEVGTTSTGNVNNLSTVTTGSTLSNLITDTGAASTIGFQVVTAVGTDTNGVNFDPRFNDKYYGLQSNTFRDGIQIATTITTGKVKFTGLDNTKKYEIIILHISNNTNNTAESTLRTDINGVIKTEYSEMNTTRPIYYGRPNKQYNNGVDQTISPTAGEIIINVQCNSTRNTNIQGIILCEI